MLTVENLEAGVCLAFGGTKARYGVCEPDNSEIRDFEEVPTPNHPDEFFNWMAGQIHQAGEDGHKWVVAGYPGLVSEDGKLIGPMANVANMKDRAYDVREEIRNISPVVAQTLDDGDIVLVNVNDGPLAAQAAAHKVGKRRFDKVAALINGTGTGSGMVIRDHKLPTIYRELRGLPNEIGHLFLGFDPRESFENTVSGTAIKRRRGVSAEYVDADDPIWHEVGMKMGNMALFLGTMGGSKLVVPTGGVGANAYEKYQRVFRQVIHNSSHHGNETQSSLTPTVKQVPKQIRDRFELFGAVPTMHDVLTSAA